MVLRRKTVSSKDQGAVDYYAEDESIKRDKSSYYTAGQQLASGDAIWIGELKADFNLPNEIEQKVFKEIAYGSHPVTKEQIRGAKRIEQDAERLFHDNCISPNKSISIAGLVLGKTEIIEAHHRSVAKVARYIEQNYGNCRKQVDGERKSLHTGKMLFAALTHYTARPVKEQGDIFVDPQLHTHLLAMNTTVTEKGEWRSLHHEMMVSDTSLGFLYNQFMAQDVQSLGFKIRPISNGFELADISDEQIATFSKRSEQAKVKLNREGKDIKPNDIHDQALKLRRAKVPDLALADLEMHWSPQAEGFQVTKHAYVDPIGYGTAAEELQSAINHLSERSTDFHVSEIYHHVFKHVQRFSQEELALEIAEHPTLIESDEKTFTTVVALEQKLEIIDAWREGIGAKTPLIEHVDLDELQKEYWIEGRRIQLNESQATAIKNALESDHQYQAIRGLAGVGKTTAIAEFIGQLQQGGEDVELFGFAGTHEAKSELEKSLKIQSRTVASLSVRGSEGRVWVIDEAGLTSNQEWIDVMRMAKAQDVRVIMMGDPGQNSSVNAGSPLSVVIRKFPETIQRMDQIIRQKNPQQLRAVELISAGRGAEAIRLLDENGWLQQISDRTERAEAAATAFTELSMKEMNETVIVSGTNAERESITEAVREKLKVKGILGDSTVIQSLKSLNLSKQQAKEARNYVSGNWIKFHRVPRQGFMNTGELYKVTQVKGNQVSIETVGGRQYKFSPAQFKGEVEVLSTKALDIAVGDRARFTATVKQNDWYNGKQLTITAVSGEWIQAVDGENKSYQISTLAPVGLDHDWAGTSYRRQGKTAKSAIISLTKDKTSSQESTTVSISRQTHNIQIFAEDTEQILRLVERSNRQPNALEQLGESDSLLADLKQALRDFEQRGGRARDHINQAIKGKSYAQSPQSAADQALIQKWTKNYNRLLSRIQRQPIEQTLQELTHALSNNQNQDSARRDDGSLSREQCSIRGATDSRGNRRSPEAERGQRQESNAGRSEQADGHRDESVNPRAEESDQRDQSTRNADRIAERIYSIRLSQELAQPLAKLREALSEWTALKQSNEALRLSVTERLSDLLLSRQSDIVTKILNDYREIYPVVVEQPKKIEPFWIPNYEGIERPPQLDSLDFPAGKDHFQELKDSSIHPDLMTANVQSIQGEYEVGSRLLEEHFMGLGAGQERTSPIRRKLEVFDSLFEGGWWATAGIEAQSLIGLESGKKPRLSTGGIFKPDYPRKDIKKSAAKGEKRTIKYENPVGRDRPFFFANIPERLAEAIYKNHDIQPTAAERESGFWHIVQKHNLPITLIEGAKKTLSSLSQGVITIGTPGITLYKSNVVLPSGKQIRLPKRELLPDLEPFATPGREITIANDKDTDPKTRRIVRQATIRSAEVLSEPGAIVKVAKWNPAQGKGADDVITESGPKVFLKALAIADPWEKDAERLYSSKYRYLLERAEIEIDGACTSGSLDAWVYQRAVRDGDSTDGLHYLHQSEGFKQGGKAYLKQVAEEIVRQQKTPPVEKNEAYYQRKYERIRNIVLRRYGQAGSQQKLDTAIAYFCRPDELGKIMVHSPAIKNAPRLEAKLYVELIQESLVSFKQQLNNPSQSARVRI